uniref:MFS domain-containing protein n=1 Tax=Steinernema glaseri TaxID=37863 RepID=A0A1I7YYF8_9BILA
MASGKPDMALKVLQKVARENGKILPEGQLVDKGMNNPQSRGSFTNLFVANLRNTTILLWFIWMCNAFCYYGIVLFTTVLFQSTDECHGGHAFNETLNMTTTECRPLVRSDYVDLLSTTLSEFPGLIITALVIEFLGRKKTMALEFSIYSIFTFLLLFCLDRRLVTAAIFIARAFISGAFQCVYVYTPEVYPTTLRALGLGSSSAMARLGAIVTPFVAQVAAGHNLVIPIVIYGLAALTGAIASMLLPIETKGRQMMHKGRTDEESSPVRDEATAWRHWSTGAWCRRAQQSLFCDAWGNNVGVR